MSTIKPEVATHKSGVVWLDGSSVYTYHCGPVRDSPPLLEVYAYTEIKSRLIAKHDICHVSSKHLGYLGYYYYYYYTYISYKVKGSFKLWKGRGKREGEALGEGDALEEGEALRERRGSERERCSGRGRCFGREGDALKER